MIAEVERLKESFKIMEKSLAASDSAMKLEEETLQKHNDSFKILINQKQQELLNTQATAKKTQEELDRLVLENKKIDDAIFGKCM